MTTPLVKRVQMNVELKAVSEDSGYIEGYANVFNVVDSYEDMTMPGAFAQDLQEFIQKGYLAVDHEWEFSEGAIGDIIEAKEDSKGLWFRAKFYSTDCSQRIRTKVTERLANKKEVGLSIGYYVIDAEQVTMDGRTIRQLKRLLVKEVSIVFAQANEPSMVTDAKSRKDEYEDLKTRCESYAQRLQDISQKGRGETWLKTAQDELKSLGDFMLAASESLVSDDTQPNEDPGSEVAFDADALRFQLESAKLGK